LTISSLCVLGLGYIGLPTASTFAIHGLKVIGVDTNPEIVNGLAKGKMHIFEPGLRELVQDAIETGNLSIRSHPETSDAFIIAVPTPFKKKKEADLDFVISASESILPYLKKGNLVILESTSPPRTTVDIVGPILEKSGLKVGLDFYLAYSPERVLPGQILKELVENTRIIGGVDQSSSEAGRELYKVFVKGEIILTDATTAEMVKLMENTYRDINIAAANEFARLADRFHVDIWEAISLANRHPRVSVLNPGPGVGGHCISVDPWFLVEAAPDSAHLIRTAREVNDNQPAYIVDFIQRKVGNLTGKHIAALGLAYKADVDDLRESPAIEVVRLLNKAGSHVSVFEPFKPTFALEGIHSSNSLNECILEAEIILLLVSHKQFKGLKPDDVAKNTRARVAIDTVHGWERPDWENAGYKFYRSGDGKN
jgi:UDP-N-acetyl-D-mannosaminuronic acid dehydrogenase